MFENCITGALFLAIYKLININKMWISALHRWIQNKIIEQMHLCQVKPLISHSGILMMLCQSIFQINAKSVKSKHIPLPHLLTYTSILTHMVNIQPVSVVKEITSILPLLIFHTWIVIYQPLPRIEFIFHNLYFTLKHAICIKTYACHYYLNSGANQGKWEKYRFCVFLRCFSQKITLERQGNIYIRISLELSYVRILTTGSSNSHDDHDRIPWYETWISAFLVILM